jgi:hypothetical protein
MGYNNNGSIMIAILWMFLISILLFWLPFIGPLLAGIVGGKKAGDVGSAILAVFLPCVVFSIILFVFTSALIGIPIIGVIAGAGVLILTLANIGPLLLGAIIGGIFA